MGLAMKITAENSDRHDFLSASSSPGKERVHAPRKPGPAVQVRSELPKKECKTSQPGGKIPVARKWNCEMTPVFQELFHLFFPLKALK